MGKEINKEKKKDEHVRNRRNRKNKFIFCSEIMFSN